MTYVGYHNKEQGYIALFKIIDDAEDEYNILCLWRHQDYSMFGWDIGDKYIQYDGGMRREVRKNIVNNKTEYVDFKTRPLKEIPIEIREQILLEGL